ncbi:outer dense fiber protein 2-like [Micropterus salmoides]|nr:outer dense fiber protein 2-like [Micropterus salmoides]
MEQQGTQLETFQQRNLLLHEENNVLKEKIHNLERRLEDMKIENKEMCQALSLKDASVRSIQQQLEEKTLECSVLSRQLQQTLDDAQIQVDNSMQRVLAKERVSQSKALDLQSQLSRAKTEQSQLQRSKEEMERRFQSQLQNMKDRLEQSDSTNRSLHNYVNFLKTSYGNVFGDSLLAS